VAANTERGDAREEVMAVHLDVILLVHELAVAVLPSVSRATALQQTLYSVPLAVNRELI
jgi:hypothetical protein